MFTRGGEAMASTAIFVGGSSVSAAEGVLAKVLDTYFGPVRVSTMFDANGCNTTAAAAVLSAMRQIELAGKQATVLGATGPVGQRVARLLASQGCRVRMASRDSARAQQALHAVAQFVDRSLLEPMAAVSDAEMQRALDGAELLFACGAAGVQLVSADVLEAASSVRVAVDLNAVPPTGIEPVEAHDRGREADHWIGYGALGVGGLKMKIHKAALASLFETNDRVLDADEIFALGRELAGV
jgi:threonine dehydrogenase-like Zn-dependent dehydrogenase